MAATSVPAPAPAPLTTSSSSLSSGGSALVNTLVLDAGPILSPSAHPSQFTSRAERIYTTPAVVAEIRDVAARQRFETLWKPFVTTRTARPASARFVAEFAKLTGDYSVLSATDMGLLALAYELELEVARGDWKLRKRPGAELNGPEPEWWRKGLDGPEEKNIERAKEVEKEPAEEEGAAEKQMDSEAQPDETAPLSESLANVKLENTSVEEIADSSEDSDSSNESDSDSEGWITPSNLHKHLHPAPTAPSTTEPVRKLTVALATADFALQNTSLQLNMPLLSPSCLQRITSTRSTVLRCHACFLIHRPKPESPTDFCPRCGGARTLLRTTCSTDENGVFRIHLKKHFQYNTRGNVYSLPKPHHGSSSGKGIPDRPVLTADQVEYGRAVRREKYRKEKDMFDPDILPGILTGSRRAPNGIRVGTGKRNPNEPRRGGGKRKH